MVAASRHCAVVGAGPAGFYCAEALLEADSCAHVTLIERLPAIFGLARYGVAPDHLKLKQVCAVFDRIACHPRLDLVGHVAVPDVVPLDFLRTHFDAVVLAVGAPVARRLHVPGESLPGCISAADLVAWYNGHPDAASLAPGLDTGRAVVVGQGNVALDIARVLLLPQARRHASDMATHALQALGQSQVRTVHVAGRRGPWQTRFSVKELRAFEQIEGLAIHVHLHGAVPTHAAHDSDDAARQAGQFFMRHAGNGNDRSSADISVNVHFHFGLAPARVRGSRRVEAVEFSLAHTEAADASPHVTLPCGLCVRSIGSHAAEFRGLVVGPHGGYANRAGQLLDDRGEPQHGLYVAGWARRGATGVIGSNRDDGHEVAHQVVQHLQATRDGPPRRGPVALHEWLRQGAQATIDQPGWARIDALERASGALTGRPRVKLVEVASLLAAAQPRAVAPVAAFDARQHADV